VAGTPRRLGSRRDDAGRVAPPGIHFYRLETGTFRRAHKVVKIE
jgi:hypothetical protein